MTNRSLDRRNVSNCRHLGWERFDFQSSERGSLPEEIDEALSPDSLARQRTSEGFVLAVVADASPATDAVTGTPVGTDFQSPA